jgi:hypothetical protein
MINDFLRGVGDKIKIFTRTTWFPVTRGRVGDVSIFVSTVQTRSVLVRRHTTACGRLLRPALYWMRTMHLQICFRSESVCEYLCNCLMLSSLESLRRFVFSASSHGNGLMVKAWIAFVRFVECRKFAGGLAYLVELYATDGVLVYSHHPVRVQSVYETATFRMRNEWKWARVLLTRSTIPPTERRFVYIRNWLPSVYTPWIRYTPYLRRCQEGLPLLLLVRVILSSKMISYIVMAKLQNTVVASILKILARLYAL